MERPRRLDHVDGLAADVPYAYAAVAPAGARLAFLAGSCPLDAEGRTVAPGDVEAQTAACLANLRAALAALDAGLDDVVFVRVLVASAARADLAAAWSLVADAFAPRVPPGTLQGATVLGWRDQLVEVEAVAALPAGGRAA